MKLEDQTLPIGRVTVIVIAACSFCITVLGVYFAAMNGVRDGFEKQNEKINDLKLRVQRIEIKQDGFEHDLNAVTSYRYGNK